MDNKLQKALQEEIKEVTHDLYLDHKDFLEEEFEDKVKEVDIYNYCMNMDTYSELENLQFTLGYIYGLKQAQKLTK